MRIFAGTPTRAAVLLLTIALVLLAIPDHARAAAGTHGMSVSTWDTSASTIVFAYQNGFLLDGGHFRMAGYNANFTSTSGKLSAQFGLHYLNLRVEEADSSAHGVSGTAVAQLAFPATDRFDNGLPKVSINFYFGFTPGALVAGDSSYLTIPLVIGMGIPLSPIRYISIVPWGELALSLNLDTIFKPFDGDLKGLDTGTIDPANPESIKLTDQQVQDIMAESVEMDLSFAARPRGGLSLVFHLGNRVDLQVNGIVTKVGQDDWKKLAIFVGGGLVIAWDKPVPAVLPASKRLEDEQCSAVANRFEECPQFGDLVEKIRNEDKDTTPVDGSPDPAETDSDAPADEPPAAAPPAAIEASTAPEATPTPEAAPVTDPAGDPAPTPDAPQ